MRCCRLRIHTVASGLQFQCQRTKTICQKNNEAWYYFFNYWIIPLLIRFSPLKYFTLWKIQCNYPLNTTQCDRFASCENIVSRSQTSLFPRWFRPCDRPKPKPPGNIHLKFTLLQLDRFRSRIFLTPAILREALWCCPFASGAISLRLLVDNLIMLHTSFSFSFVENHFVVKID